MPLIYRYIKSHGKTATYASINYFLFHFSLCIGDFISGLNIEIRNERRHRLNFIRYDLKLLRKLSEPITVYDVIKELRYPHSSAHNILKQYLRQGIIRNVKIEELKSGFGVKKYYRLTELGFNLLSLLEKVNENRLNIAKVKR